MEDLKCQGEAGCPAEVTHIDNKGFIYCTHHGERRRSAHPCRKMLKREIVALQRGEAIWWDSRRQAGVR